MRGNHSPEPICIAMARLCRVGRLRVLYSVEDRLRSHDFNGAMVRGGFGTALHTLHRGRDVYHKLFCPDEDDGQRLLPYRLRDVSGQRMLMEPGTLFEFGLDLFGVANELLEETVQALAWMGFAGLGPEKSKLHLRSVMQELPDGNRAAVWTERSGLRAAAHTTLADYPLPQAGRYLLTLKSPTTFRSNGQAVRPSLLLIVESATRRMARFAGLDVTDRYHVNLVGRQDWITERTFMRKSRREGEQAMRGWVGAFEVSVTDPADAAPLWAARLIGVGRHTTFGFGDVELDTVDAFAIPRSDGHASEVQEINR